MKKRYKTLLFLLIIALLIFLITRININEMYDNLKKMDLKFALISFILISLSYIIWNYRWFVLLPKKVKMISLYPVLMSGIFISTITPGARVGGEPVRAYLLSKKYKGTQSKYLATILLEKTFSTVIFFLLILISLLFLVFFIQIPSTIKIIIELLILLTFILAISGYFLRSKIKNFKFKKLLYKIYNFPLSKLIRKKFKTYSDFENMVFKKIDEFKQVFKKGFTSKKILTKQLISSILIWLLRFLSSYFLFLALGYKFNLFLVMIVITLTYLVGDLSVVPGGIGFMEIIMISLYSSMSVPLAIATVVSLSTRLFDYFNTLFIGGLSFAYSSWRYK